MKDATQAIKLIKRMSKTSEEEVNKIPGVKNGHYEIEVQEDAPPKWSEPYFEGKILSYFSCLLMAIGLKGKLNESVYSYVQLPECVIVILSDQDLRQVVVESHMCAPRLRLMVFINAYRVCIAEYKTVSANKET